MWRMVGQEEIYHKSFPEDLGSRDKDRDYDLKTKTKNIPLLGAKVSASNSFWLNTFFLAAVNKNTFWKVHLSKNANSLHCDIILNSYIGKPVIDYFHFPNMLPRGHSSQKTP